MSIAELGRPSLAVAAIFVLVSIAFSIAAAVRRDARLSEAGKRSLVATAAFVGVAGVALVTAFFTHDFSYVYVANYSSMSLTGPYTFAALWGGMEGSLLFWTILLTAFSAIALSRSSRWASPGLNGWATAVLGGVALFFLVLLLFPADPFARLHPIPADGQGLNPLLQSPGMLIHPPLLYTGFVAFSIPFAFAMGALLARRLDEMWFAFTRRWSLFAWSALSVGIVLGGAWAYTELGWGGYWAWDPVENASFMPWLTATAYLHSVVIQEKRRMFKVWNVALILMTYVLAIFGTFLTRSGILSSIHTFTEGPIGKWFLPFLGLMLLGGLAIIAMRLDDLRSENTLDSALSRESAFLFNNVLFVAAAFAVLWGTIYPVVAELLTGVRLIVGPPFFNTVFVPIGLSLLALAGLGPLITWRRMRPDAFLRNLRAPLIAASAMMLLTSLTLSLSLGVLVAVGLCAFTAVAVTVEFGRGSRVHRNQGMGWVGALSRTMSRNRRRYGGYVVHLGVVLIVIGFIGTSGKLENHIEMERGSSAAIGDYRLTYENLHSDVSPEKRTFAAQLSVTKDGEPFTTLFPQRNFHTAQRQWQSEVAIRSTPIEDLYVVVTSFDPDGTASVRVFVNPLTWWIWMGAALMAAGMIFIMVGPTPVTAAVRTRKAVGDVAVATR